MRTHLEFRKATKVDIPTIQELAHRIWPENYASILSEQQIHYMMNLMYSESSIIKDIENNKPYFLINLNRKPAGYFCIELNYLKKDTLYVHKIYILQNQQGKGLGLDTINYIEEYAKQHNQKHIQLNVNRCNNAKQFYERIGFTIQREEDIDIGNGYWMNDYVMTKNL